MKLASASRTFTGPAAPGVHFLEEPEVDADEHRRDIRLVARAAKAVNAVVGGRIDDVIDPADTRRWIINSLKRLPPLPPRTTKKYPYVDTW